ncbi:hypothetical protein JCM10908_001749 [Rhodotorula pacifica]|uniref:VWA and PH domain-containing RING finger protein n=1 Tax=Rhodotorula pacifica TaxID=1495444 RepID=UPI0031774876
MSVAFSADVRRPHEVPFSRAGHSGGARGEKGQGQGQGPTSWPLTPSNSQDSVESSADPQLSTPSNSTDGLIPIANDVRYSTHSALGLFKLAPDRTSRVSVPCSIASSVAVLPTNRLLRPARRLPPPPLAFPTTPPPSPPRDIAKSSESCPAAIMNSAITDDCDEETCPICLELLSLRLQGERPHVVPVCGHRLHHSCFEAVYGDVSRAKARTSGSLGLCGVCRRDMKIGDGSEVSGRKANKFAKLTGLSFGGGGGSGCAVEQPSFKLRSRSKGTLDAVDDFDPEPKDKHADDELVRVDSAVPSTSTTPFAGPRSSGSTGGTAHGSLHGSTKDIVRPILTVRSEHSSVERNLDSGQKQHLTCMISIEMPPRHPPPAIALELLAQSQSARSHGPSGSLPPIPSLPPSASAQSLRSTPRSASPTSSSVYSAYAYGSSGQTHPPPTAPALARAVEDLRDRMADWKGHSLEEFGALRIYDCINVRKDSATREFVVYLFEQAILCVADEKRKGSTVSTLTGSASGDRLRLKGRVYLRHVRAVTDTSTDEELSLTIAMTDEAVAEFVMVFQERTSLEVWKAQIEQLLSRSETRPRVESTYPQTPASAYPPSRSRRDVLSDLSTSDRSHFTASSSQTRTTNTSLAPSSSTMPEEPACEDDFGVFIRQQAANMSTPPVGLGFASPLPSTMDSRRDFTPVDLMLVVSIPSAGSGTLKTDIIKNALQCLVANAGPLTRIALVAFTTGEGTRGMLRKTPFLAVGRSEGRKRLETAIDELTQETEMLSALSDHKEDRISVVTACNLALDSVMQRKTKSALTGFVLVNEGRDGAGKQQMDLIMARAEAANVPIHAIGYGRSHDPSSLWLLSNHTSGSYTFVKDFYDLRDALLGCVGGILSIAATHLRLHVKVPESRWFRIRKVSGTPGAVVAQTGIDVDIDLGELRFGERKDLVVEVEMSFDGYEQRGASDSGLRADARHVRDFSSATDTFFMTQAGIDLSVLDAPSGGSLYADEYDSMPEEVPLFQVNAAYRDPAAGKSISRLTQTPTLLTITVGPQTTPARQQVNGTSCPELVRRRVELLVSDMLSRALLLMTRRNDEQALRLLGETKRIIASISASLRGPVPNSASSSSLGSSYTSSASPSSSLRRGSNAATAHAQAALIALARDVDAIHEAFLNRETFETQGRYQAAQQAVVLRDQRSWTPKSGIERLFWRSDNSLWMVSKSQQWISP